MKKIGLILLGFILGIIFTFGIVINNIEIDAINELDNGVVTIKIFNYYFDYYYENA